MKRKSRNNKKSKSQDRSSSLSSELLDELNQLYQSSSVCLALLDLDLRYVRINKYLAALNERHVKDHIDRTIHEIIPDIAQEVEPILRKAINTGEPILNVEIKTRSQMDPKQHSWFIANYYPLRGNDKKVKGVNVIFQNIKNRDTSLFSKMGYVPNF